MLNCVTALVGISELVGQEEPLDLRGSPSACLITFSNAQVAQLCTILDIMIPEAVWAEPNPERIENAFLFALVWSVGATLKGEEHERFDKFLRALSGKAILSQSLFDSFYDMQTCSWLTWESQVSRPGYRP